MNGVKVHNHLYPAYHIKKWIDNNGLIYDKNKKENIEWQRQSLFTKDYYYSLGEHNQILEDHISKFEQYISKIIKRIDESEENVELTANELEILKLYCVLTACRQEFTSEFIKSDESEYYHSNNYLFGIPKLYNQEEVVNFITRLMDVFDNLYNKSDDYRIYVGPHQNFMNDLSCPYTLGTHLSIIRSNENAICISNIYAIIENTMDGDHLYTYIPVSPKTALCLVKTKYYFDDEKFEFTKYRLGMKYGGKPDPYLSVILGASPNDFENVLFCSYRQKKGIK